PTHRALDDARATVDVLHGLLERLGNLGVHTLPELTSYTRRVSDAQRRKRHLADDLPRAPGIYVFRAEDDRPLYVGTSRDIRSRVRNYFVSYQTRSRIGEMIAVASRVEAIVCAHALEAEVRELRLITAHKPPYNVRSKYPERTWWLSLTSEAYPRLSLVRKPSDSTRCLGPFRAKAAAEGAAEAIYEALPIRQCTAKLSTRRASPACVLADMGRCGAPCQHREDEAAYRTHVTALLEGFRHDPSDIIEPVLRRIEGLAAVQRYEDAAMLRDRLAHLVRGLVHGQRTQTFTSVAQLTAASRVTEGWNLAVIRRGRLAAASVAASTAEVLPALQRLVQTAETVLPIANLMQPDESLLLLKWLDKPETRVVEIDGSWDCPARGAGRWEHLLDKLHAPPRWLIL
ncbi:MAG: DEDD exonuclease domain-containing protein, partial [Pseudonocardiaceae bacterium]